MRKGHNHYDDCECGWCGGPRIKRTPKEQAIIDQYLFESEELNSYLNPNTICPVCGEKVFFFQARNGVRVFFDEVGPPWPKHPCTDNNDYMGFGKYHYQPTLLKTEEVRANWKDDGWQPFKVVSHCILQSVGLCSSYHVMGYALIRPEVEISIIDYEFNSLRYHKDFIFIKELHRNYHFKAMSMSDIHPTTWTSYKSYEDLVNAKKVG